MISNCDFTRSMLAVISTDYQVKIFACSASQWLSDSPFKMFLNLTDRIEKYYGSAIIDLNFVSRKLRASSISCAWSPSRKTKDNTDLSFLAIGNRGGSVSFWSILIPVVNELQTSSDENADKIQFCDEVVIYQSNSGVVNQLAFSTSDSKSPMLLIIGGSDGMVSINSFDVESVLKVQLHKIANIPSTSDIKSVSIIKIQYVTHLRCHLAVISRGLDLLVIAINQNLDLQSLSFVEQSFIHESTVTSLSLNVHPSLPHIEIFSTSRIGEFMSWKVFYSYSEIEGLLLLSVSRFSEDSQFTSSQVGVREPNSMCFLVEEWIRKTSAALTSKELGGSRLTGFDLSPDKLLMTISLSSGLEKEMSRTDILSFPLDYSLDRISQFLEASIDTYSLNPLRIAHYISLSKFSTSDFLMIAETFEKRFADKMRSNCSSNSYSKSPFVFSKMYSCLRWLYLANAIRRAILYDGFLPAMERNITQNNFLRNSSFIHWSRIYELLSRFLSLKPHLQTGNFCSIFTKLFLNDLIFFNRVSSGSELSSYSGVLVFNQSHSWKSSCNLTFCKLELRDSMYFWY